jgi:hypothetical protein
MQVLHVITTLAMGSNILYSQLTAAKPFNP